MDLDIEPAWNPGDANMNIEEFRGLVEKRRSTRGYEETREVSDDMIKTILDCARWAPSGGNGQPWEFYRRARASSALQDCRLLYEATGAKARNGSRRARHGENDGRWFS